MNVLIIKEGEKGKSGRGSAVGFRIWDLGFRI